MKDQNLYRVTVIGTYQKEVLVAGESEKDAMDYVQDICDSTDLISFDEGDIVELLAEDAINLEDEGCDHDCDNCPAVACVPTFPERIMPAHKPSAPSGASKPHKDTPSQPVKSDAYHTPDERGLQLMGVLITQFYQACEDFDALRDTVVELLETIHQQESDD